MKKFSFLILIILSSFSFAQTKYLIYFKDKGIKPDNRLLKGSAEYNSAIELLTEKCIKRRLKTLGEDSLVTYEDLPIKPDYVEELKSLGIKIQNQLKWFNVVSAYLTDQQVSQISELSFVEKTEPVKILEFTPYNFDRASFIPKVKQVISVFDYGPSYDQLQLSDIPIVHSNGITGQGVLFGLLDTGFDWQTHESLQSRNVVAEYDFVFGDQITANQQNDVPGQDSHGTLVFSIAGGFKDSSLIGAAFGADFILAKTEDIRSETHVEEDNYAAALEWMENYGVDITSSSLGYNIFDPSTYSYSYKDMNGRTTIVTRACEVAYRKGVTTITSAGNEGLTSWRYIIAPADGFNTLAIGAVDANNIVAGFSSLGPTYDGRIKPDLVTRGVNVIGAAAGTIDQYSTASGTSVAAPIASGIAALLLSAHPHLINDQIRNIFYETSGNSLNPDNERGYGLISALKAVEYPNLEIVDQGFKLHKIILDPSDVVPNSVRVRYSLNGGEFLEHQMDFDNNLTYTFSFPSFFNNDKIDFFFTYNTSNNINFREPQTDNYSFFYGQLNISHNLEPSLNDLFFTVSEPYPNPFVPAQYGFVRISINSGGGEKVKMIVTDAIGQKVNELHINTVYGTNNLDWNGKTTGGFPVASGIYFLLIEKNGEKFGRKLVLLK